MNCKMEFKHKFITSYLGEDFISKILKPKIIKELMVEQKSDLSSIQPLVDWFKECKQIKSNARFGVKQIKRYYRNLWNLSY